MGLLLYVGYRIIVSLFSAKKSPSQPSESRNPGVETHRDPVCGIYVSEETAVIGRHDGKRHYFCSINCLEKYRERLDVTSPS
jgi:YHS domain-containing protein